MLDSNTHIHLKGILGSNGGEIFLMEGWVGKYLYVSFKGGEWRDFNYVFGSQGEWRNLKTFIPFYLCEGP